MSNTSFMSPAALRLVAARFKVLGDPTRLRILQNLQQQERSVGELAAALETTQPNVSKHLRILQDAGLVRRRPEGNTVYCSIADESVFLLCELVCERLRDQFEAQASALPDPRGD